MSTESFEYTDLPEEEDIRFGFCVAVQPNGSMSEPILRSEVNEYDLGGAVSSLLRGDTPDEFNWLEPVVRDQQESGKVNKSLRFMAVARELLRAQNAHMRERDIAYEEKVAALGRLLYDACDEHFNFLGFSLQLKTKDATVHQFEWGRLNLHPDSRRWWVDSKFSLSYVEDVVTKKPPMA